MKNWKIIGAITLLVLAIAAWRIISYERERNAPGVVANKPAQRQLSDDQMVFVRTMLIDSMKSARVLNGKSVWMKTGYTVVYYPYRTGRIVFPQPAGWLPPAQELQVKDFVEVTTPRTGRAAFRAGRRMRSSSSRSRIATASLPLRWPRWMARMSSWACDDIFFYDDPKTLYHWPADVWQAVSQHTAKQGMSEFQTTMALGNIQQSDSKDFGNRTVKYVTVDQGQTHHFSVTFSGDKATSVSSRLDARLLFQLLHQVFPLGGERCVLAAQAFQRRALALCLFGADKVPQRLLRFRDRRLHARNLCFHKA